MMQTSDARTVFLLSSILLVGCGGADESVDPHSSNAPAGSPAAIDRPSDGPPSQRSAGGETGAGGQAIEPTDVGGMAADDGGGSPPPLPPIGGVATPGPRNPDETDEARQLQIPFDDPTDARTVSAVYGLRRLVAVDATTLQAIYGPSFSRPGADQNPQAFNIYSPDDSHYALEQYVQPVSVSVEAVPTDFAAPADRFVDAPLDSYHVTLKLPQEMQMGARYFVRGIGGRTGDIDAETQYRAPWIGDPITGGRGATSLVFGAETDPNDAIDDGLIGSVMGVRNISMVGAGWVRITVGGGGVIDRLKQAETFTLTNANNLTSTDGVSPSEIGIRTATEVVVPGFGYPYPRRLARTDVYLRFETAFNTGETYTLALTEGATTGRSAITFTYDDDRLFNPHLKVNQEGYRPGSKDKLVLFGAWMGTAGTLSFETPPAECVVVDEDTGVTALTAPMSLRHRAGVEDEGAYPPWNKPGADFTREDVYTCDISALEDEGTYYVKIKDMGRSYPFRIAHDVYARAFRVAMRGLFYQRAGQALDDTNSAYRREAGHVEPVRIPYLEDKPIIGGHYDAGDFNPRAHYEVVYDLMLAYDLHRAKFYDGQLDCPESANGIPDILDEAAWGIRPFLELQAPDGSVGGRDDGVSIESTSDPNFIQTSERDPHFQDSFEPHPRASFNLAALAGTAARLWGDLGKQVQADAFLEAATRAYDWAVAHLDDGPQTAEITDTWAWAAATLAHTTGEAKYTADFVRSGYEYAGIFDDGSTLRMRAAAAYAHNAHANADIPLKMLMRDGLKTYLDAMTAPCESYVYPHFQHIYAPVNWGTAAYPSRSHQLVAMHVLSDDEAYARWLERSAHFALGANPLNLSWITGLGDNPIYGPMHLFGWHNYQGIIPIGLQSEGPNQDADYISRYAPYNEPEPADTPPYYNYYDLRYAPGLNEGVAINMSATAMLFGALLPDQTE
ncbi:MAG: glycoside hydrolase family 9 protein [Myxococcota bacterium]|nr:glycoside hydrolase family 9 protein [Myxococcota bacterium]